MTKHKHDIRHPLEVQLMIGRLLALSVAFLGMGSSLASAAIGAEPDLRQRVDRLVTPYIEHEVVVGMTVGVLAEGRQWVAGYGRLSAGQDQPPDGETVYEIGSISKVFTGILLGDAVARRELTLQQAVGELLPGEPGNLAKDEQPVQLWHLATHTSGLPRLPNNMRPTDLANPYADYSVEQLHACLKAVELSHVPGEKADYSNLGMGLLGHLLAQKAGLSYERLVTERIAKPLGMNSTGIELSASMRERLAPPHSADGLLPPNWDLPTLAGAGALRGTANDLLRLLAAHLDPPQGELAEALDLAWKIHWEPKDNPSFAMGLGWHVARDGHSRWHTGQTGGYHGIVFVSRQLKTAVVVLANTATGEVDRLAEDVFRMLAGAEVEPREFVPAVEVAADVMRRYVGRYALAPEFHLTVTLEEDRLMVQATGQPAARVFPKTDTQWFYKVVNAQLTFQTDEQGRCQGLILHQSGREMPARRVEDE
jgi:serine-type D-Ala-D-Ala carboxypeptidase/endopeptidase